MDEIARQIDPLLQEWIEYYGRGFPPSAALYPLLQIRQSDAPMAWAMRKFKRFTAHKIR